MNISDEVMHFRNERARELEIVAMLLEKIETGISTPIVKAAGQLRNKSFILPYKDGSVDKETWGYEIEDFNLAIVKPRHMRPANIQKLSLTLNMKMIAKCSEWDNLSDPLCELSFRVSIRGVGDKSYYTGFHIDRHDHATMGSEPHPIYHLQHIVNPTDESSFEYGTVLYLDTPRTMHYPMDFILGLGFLTSNFFPFAWEMLQDDGHYCNLYRKYQDKIWKPYSHTIANYWKPFVSGDVVWSPNLICPYLLN